MITGIVSIISSVMSLVAMIFGNALLSKWLGAWLFWLRQKAAPQILADAEANYQLLLNQWKPLNDARNNLPPSTSDPSVLDDKK